jgi:hypothetical protein
MSIFQSAKSTAHTPSDMTATISLDIVSFEILSTLILLVDLLDPTAYGNQHLSLQEFQLSI